jgi:hypothetical protein
MPPRSFRAATKKPRPAPRCFRIEEVGRGCETNAPHSNREPGFFVIAIEKVFSFRPDWHQDDRVKPLVQQYQLALDSILRSHPKLPACVTHCVQCGIRFLTDRRNARRQDLRCPFGCREHHQKQRANARSAAYYRTAHGKAQKERHNHRRYRSTGPADGKREPAPDPQTTSPNEQPTGESPEKVEWCLEGMTVDASSVANSPMLPYVRMLVRVIEGVQLSRQELVDCLQEALRQRSMATRSRATYVLRFLNLHPP